MHRSNLLLQSARQLRSRSSRLHSSSTRSTLPASTQCARRYTSMASSTAPSWSEWRLDPPCAIPSDSATLAHHASLPKLPVPELKSTAEKVLRSARALAKDDDEYKALESKFDAFLKPDGPGQRLQSKLQARAKDEKVPSFLAEWWDTQGYMAYRDPVVLNVSYYYGFHKLPQSLSSSQSPHEEPNNPAFVAASLVSTILDFRADLLAGKVEPDAAGGTKLCMESYKWMFNACRIPAKPADYAIKLREDAKEGAHFIAIRNNAIYKLPLFDTQGRKYSFPAFESAFKQLYSQSDSSTLEPVGILTGVNRDLWTDARAHLLDISPDNVATLSAIESASFVICLDPAAPSSQVSSDGSSGSANVQKFSRELFHGNGENRWFDKPLQWIVFDSGEAGFIGEHSCMDGTPTMRMNHYLGDRLSKRDISTDGASGTIKAEKLAFTLDEATRSSIQQAKSEYDAAVDGQDLGYLYYTRYGKNGIKAAKSSPDGWVQMVMQLAYALTYPEAPITGTYEAAMTRRYALGRTETVRVCSPASKAFVLASLPGSDANDTEKRRLFLEALKQHGADMKDASNAMGCDRHIFGLKMIKAELGQGEKETDVALFDDGLLKRSGTWQLSTSAITSKHFVAYGWGQVVPDGFGLPYSIHDNHLVFTVTSKKGRRNAEMVENLRVAADMLMDSQEAALKQEGKAKM